MRTITLNEKTFKNVLSLAERILKSGGVIIAPTDTVYGILGNATRAEVVKEIFIMKQRPKDKAFPIFVKDVSMARKYAYISDSKARILEKIWPGPVTVVFYHKEKLPRILTWGKDTIGIRLPNYYFLRELLLRLEFPLVQTSANVSGVPPAQNAEEIKKYFENSKSKPDLIINAGQINGVPSMVINFIQNEPAVLRMGAVSKEKFDEMLSFMK